MSEINNITPLSVAGGYWTGSSAVVDILAEHENCNVVPGEFSMFSFGQFFKEVFDPLYSKKIDGTLLDSNLKRIIDFNLTDMRPIRPALRYVFSYFKFYPNLFFNPRTGMYKILGEDYKKSCLNFIEQLKLIRTDISLADIGLLRDQISKILHHASLGVNNYKDKSEIKYGVFDQLIAPPYIDMSKTALSKIKFINVDRDWRDQYISLRYRYSHMMARNRNLGIRPFDEDLSIVNTKPLDFMISLRKKIDEVKKIQNDKSSKDILWLEYENIVLDPKKTVKKIFDFLDLDPEKWKPNQFFFPDQSSERIGKWKNEKFLDASIKREIAEMNDIYNGSN
jgi:hypothetical protein